MGVLDLGLEDPLDKETAIHSSILAWDIAWTEEPGALGSLVLQRVGHDLATEQVTSPILTCVVSVTQTETELILKGPRVKRGLFLNSEHKE